MTTERFFFGEVFGFVSEGLPGITIRALGRTETAATDQDGCFVFPIGDPGSVSLEFTTPGGKFLGATAASLSVDLKNRIVQYPDFVHLNLPAYSSMSLILRPGVDPADDVVLVQVFGDRQEPIPYRSLVTGESQFTVTGLGPGFYLVGVRREDASILYYPGTVDSGSATVFELGHEHLLLEWNWAE
ncbi:MAG: hypothetical protein GC160_08610 [Acidobacteria bacterium]|nr:hypothetical protein [Acidobacteriota bacterium]